MNPTQPTPQVPDSVAMASAINGLGQPPAPTVDLGGGQPAPAPAPQQPPQEPEGDGFFGTPPNPTAPPMPQYPTPPAMPPQAPAPAAPPQVAPAQPPQPPQQPPQAPPAAPAQPDPNSIPLPTPGQPMPQAPAGDQPPAWAQEVIDAAKTIQQQQAQPAPGTVPAGQGQPQQSDWNPQNWADVDARIEARAQELFRNGLTEIQSQQQAQAEAEQQALAQADAAIDQSLNQLRQTGYLPPVANPNDRDDAGKIAERELIAYTIAQGTDNLLATAPVLHALHQSGYYYDAGQNKLVRKGSQTAAAQAPIAGATPSVTPAQGGATLTYSDLANTDLRSMADRAAAAFPSDNQGLSF